MAIRRPSDGMAKPQWRLYETIDNPEYQLGENLVTEYTDIVGIACTYYISDTAIEPDQLYGEKMDVAYKDGMETKIIYDVSEIPTIYSMFGVMAQDTITAYIPRSVFKRDVSQTEPPKVGDVVKIPMYPNDFSDDPAKAGRTFEIQHVAQDTSYFQYRSLVYVFNLIPYRYSEESVSAADVSSDLSTTSPSITAYGDNEWVDENLDSDPTIDKGVYGY